MSATTTHVIVTGASSVIGAYLLPRLSKQGFIVHAISRQADQQITQENVIWQQWQGSLADTLDTQQHYPILFHLAPIWILPPMLADFAKLGGQRLIAFSSTSRFSKAESENPKERELADGLMQAERQLQTQSKDLGLIWTLFRPTLIYGLGRDKNISLIASFIRRFYIFPLLGQATGKRQPVHAEDLANACLLALPSQASQQQAYNLTGGETLAYREMVRRIYHTLGRKPLLIPLPLSLLRVLLYGLRLIPQLRWLTPQMLERMNQDLEFDAQKAKQDFGYSARGFYPELRDIVDESTNTIRSFNQP